MSNIPPPENIYAPDAVRGLFNRMSRSYERMNIVFSFGFSVRWRRQMLRLVPDTQEAAVRALDAMSGMGETWGELLRRYPSADAHALDFSEQMMAHAATRNEERFENRFTLHCADMLDNQLPNAAYDVIISAYGVKTFDAEQSKVFTRELVRLLRPGGSFAFIEVTQPPNRVLRALYMFYLARIVPHVGRLLVSDPIEYRMLHRYLAAYGAGEHTTAALAQHPELVVTKRLHFFGCATSWSGYRLTETGPNSR